jgi:hypothetical protein
VGLDPLTASHCLKLKQVTNSVGRVLLEKMTVAQLAKELTALYWTGKHITVLSPSLKRILSQIIPVYTVPNYYFKIHFNIIIPPMLSIPSGFFPYDTTANIL